VRLWDCKNRGNCLSVVEVGGQVDSLLLEGGYLFVGIRVQGMQPVPGLIKVSPCPTQQSSSKASSCSDMTGHDHEPPCMLSMFCGVCVGKEVFQTICKLWLLTEMRI
jgi:hypothetical protein